MKIQLWKIAVFRPLRNLLYYLPAPGYESQPPDIGVRVKIPVRNSESIGIFLGTTTNIDIPQKNLRSVLAVLDEQFIIDANLLKLNIWASEYYHHPIGDVLCNSLPTLLRQGKAATLKTEPIYTLTENGNNIKIVDLKKTPKQAFALTIFQQQKMLTLTQLKQFNITPATLNHLLTKLYINKGKRELFLQPKQKNHLPKEEHQLNPQQNQVLTDLLANLNRFSTHLLYGITGSGKTEIYLRIIEQVIVNQQQALVLVPEIGLTSQIIARFEQRFQVPIAVFHSNLTERQRLDTWILAKNNIAKIVIGTRSAVFSPLNALGIIIIDEEHDSSFKQQEGFRYSARDLAIKRAQQENIPIILGSATPSLESIYNYQQQRYQLLELTQRAGQAELPKLSIIDIRNQKLDHGLSHLLKLEIKKHLAADGQVLVFLNRRGFAPTLICHSCGWTAQCRRCDARMTLHQQPKKLICHHCNVQQNILTQCPQCMSMELFTLGLGTERLESVLDSYFKEYGVMRIDRDNIKKKDALDIILGEIHQGRHKLLIGTQMLAKGHHFPNVTLAAIVDADTGFLSADFRASERMGQLIMQVAGRAGRAKKRGEVFIQTRFPENPLLQVLIQGGYQAFAKELLQQRQQAQLPPFYYLSLIRADAFNLDLIFTFLNQVKNICLKLISSEDFKIMGPIPAPMSKKAGKFQGQLLLQSKTRVDLHRISNQLINQIGQKKLGTKLKWSLDVDPVDLF